MQAALFVALVVAVYGDALLGYLRDQYYQEHFAYLWAFLGLALWRTLRRPFRGRFALTTGRDRLGVALALLAAVLFAASELGGTSTGARTSLVVLATGLALLAVPNWSRNRCLLHGLLLLMCFGLPASTWFRLTSLLQLGVARLVALPATFGWADYEVTSTAVRFPHYQLQITPECSGIGQLVTFSGIAALAALSSAPARRRTVLVFALAVALAWLSNLARVGLFVLLVGLDWTDAVDDPFWHATIGLLVFLPFVALLVVVILRTHRPIAATYRGDVPSGRHRIAWLALPLALAALTTWQHRPDDLAEPPYFAALEAPPGHVLELRAPSEQRDRASYETPWLINARFRADDGQWFDLMHYATASHGHLCVHDIPTCMFAPGQRVRRAEPVELDGRRWWPIALDRDASDLSLHVYYAFDVAGARCDDSEWTRLRVWIDRLTGGDGVVRLTRVVLPGPLPDRPTEYEQRVLSWIGRTTAAGR